MKKSDMDDRDLHTPLDGIRYDGAGRFTSRGKWIHPEANNATWEYLLILSGTVHLEEGDRRYDLFPGDLLRLDPGIPHRGTLQSDPPVSFYWVHFSGNGIESFVEESLPKAAHPLCRDRLLVLFRQLLHYGYVAASGSAASRGASPYPAGTTDAVLRLLLAELAAEKSADGAPGSSLFVRICEWCRTNWDKGLTVATVSAHFGYNEDHLTRLFRRYGGAGLKEYIDECRLEKIRALLVGETDPLPLKEIARLAGFDDCKSFLKYFKYHEGVTPTAYRNLFPGTHTNDH